MTPSKSEKVIEKTAAVVICQTDFAKVLRSANQGSGETASHLQVADVDLVASASEVRLTKHSHDVSHSRFSPRIGRRLQPSCTSPATSVFLRQVLPPAAASVNLSPSECASPCSRDDQDGA